MDKLFIPVSDSRPISQHFDELARLVNDFHKIALTSTVQFKHQLPLIKDLLKEHEVVVGPTILGCSHFNLKAECIVLVATGVFHAINLAVKTGKPVFIISPEGVSRLNDIVVKNFLKKQAIRVSKFLEAKTIGVIVSIKSGQSHEVLAERIIKKLRAKGKNAFLFVANELSPAQLNDFPVDAWVNTACPRIIEDEFDKPIVNWDELKEL